MEKQKIINLIFDEMKIQDENYKSASAKKDYTLALKHNYASSVLTNFGIKINSMKWE